MPISWDPIEFGVSAQVFLDDEFLARYSTLSDKEEAALSAGFLNPGAAKISVRRFKFNAVFSESAVSGGLSVDVTRDVDINF